MKRDDASLGIPRWARGFAWIVVAGSLAVVVLTVAALAIGVVWLYVVAV